MMHLKVKDLQEQDLTMALQKLGRINDNEVLSIKTRYDIGRVIELMEKEHVRWNKIRFEIQDKVMEKDKDGKPVPFKHPETGAVDPSRFMIKEGMQPVWDKDHEEWLNQDVKIERKKIKISDIQKAPLSGIDISVLMFMLTGFEELEEGVTDEKESEKDNVTQIKDAIKKEGV